MKYKSYRKKLITIFILISVIPLVFTTFIANFNLRNEVIEEKIKYLNYDIVVKSENLDIVVFDKKNVLNSILQNYNLIRDNLNNELEVDKTNEFLYNQEQSFENILNLYIVTEEGFKYNSKSMEIDVDVRERPWYIGAKEKMDFFWTTPYKDLLSNKMVITLSKPIINKDNKLEGVIGLDIDFNLIQQKLKEIRINDASTTYLLDENGNKLDVVGKDIIESFLDIKYKDILENKKNEIEHEMGHNHFLVYTAIDSNNWKIVAMVSKSELIPDLIDLNKYLIFVIIITLFIVIGLAFKYGKQFSKPLEKLKEGAKQIQEGNYNFKIDINNNDEFDDVSHVFNDMTSNLKNYYEGLKNRTTELEEMNTELEASYEQLEATLRQLNDSEDKYRMLVENMNDIVWIVDADYNVVFVNDAISNILKFDKDRIIGKNIENLRNVWKDRYSFQNILVKSKESDITNTIIALVDDEGTEKIVSVSTKRIIENGNLIGVQGIMRDVTERELMEREILRKNEELTVINKISENLNSNLNLDLLLNRVAIDLTKLLNISLCSIRIFNDKGNLELKAVDGELKEYISKDDIDLECIDDLLENQEFNSRGIPEICCENYNEGVSKIFEKNYSSVIPIKSKHNVSGLIIVSSENIIKENEINIIKSVVNQTAMVIDNIKLYNDLKRSYIQIIEGLVTALDAKDSYTEGHSYRVSKYSHLIAQRFGLSDKECEEIEISGILHDIGKIGINDEILSKPGQLNDEEYNVITTHPMIGSKILEKVGVSDNILNGVRYHHKRFDLKGYPKELELKSIPIEASIIGVADAFDAMTSNRSYRNSLDFNTALDEIIKHKGTQFNPIIVDILADLVKKEKNKVLEVVFSKQA